MESLKIYRMRDDYIRFLNGIDPRVQYNKDGRRPYVGVVLEIREHKYFVPMESPKPNHAKLRGNIHIMKLDGGKLGLLGFNNMVPALERHLIDYDIDAEPDVKYRNLLRNQLRFCNDHKAEIFDRAERTYRAVIKGKIPFFVSISCNFRLLEEMYGEYE